MIRRFIPSLLTTLALVWCANLVCQAQQPESAVSGSFAERKAWRESIKQIPVPGNGCFHAAYPSTQWEVAECKAPSAYRSALPKITNWDQVVGNGYDYVAQAPSGHLFSSVEGSFPSVTGVTSESSVGVPAFGNAGILGPNEYTLQVNTNFYHSAACGSYSSCRAWQQYVMSTNTPVSLTSNSVTNETEVFIEYWLIDYGSSNSSACPYGFIKAENDYPGVDCVQNTPATFIAYGQLPITDLASLTLSGSATANGTDVATVTFDGEAWAAGVYDYYTDIASGWSQAEFNVFGNAGGSEAVFNTGSNITVNLAVNDGSTAAPTCIAPSSDAGTTGETNNLTLSSTCTASGGSTPGIQFTENNGPPAPPPPTYTETTTPSSQRNCGNQIAGYTEPCYLTYAVTISVAAGEQLYVNGSYVGTSYSNSWTENWGTQVCEEVGDLGYYCFGYANPPAITAYATESGSASSTITIF